MEVDGKGTPCPPISPNAARKLALDTCRRSRIILQSPLDPLTDFAREGMFEQDFSGTLPIFE
jgi:hypothetical protein